eukprot:SAG11_NODE_1869_length_4151_cov_5.154245_7_plen_56_part_00
MPSICDTVDFEHICREWRCKWSEDGAQSEAEYHTILTRSTMFEKYKSALRVVKQL